MDKKRIGSRGSVIAVIAGIIVGLGLASVSMLEHKDEGSRSRGQSILSQGFNPLNPNAPLLTGGVPVTIPQAPPHGSTFHFIFRITRWRRTRR
jgi:hypothetical protein